MATISITVNDAHLTRVIDALKVFYNFASTALDGETEGQFAKRMVAEHVILITRRIERATATAAAIGDITDADIT